MNTEPWGRRRAWVARPNDEAQLSLGRAMPCERPPADPSRGLPTALAAAGTDPGGAADQRRANEFAADAAVCERAEKRSEAPGLGCTRGADSVHRPISAPHLTRCGASENGQVQNFWPAAIFITAPIQ